MSADRIALEPPRFSIRLPRPLWLGLVTAMLVVSVAVVQIGLPIYRQEAMIREIEGLGGIVKTRTRCPAWLRERLPKKRVLVVDEVNWVYLERTAANDDTLSRMGSLTALQSLRLADAINVTDIGLAHLKGLTGLQRLTLGHTQVTGTGVAELERALPGVTIRR